ncbi:MAG: glutamine--fructose-6-phosphate transaminase (isomerizing) [Aquisalinus sp.]|nr:glutamine--fructose-6-phosphate transaminase (isomerizing) [Aquisalinus sp.]
MCGIIGVIGKSEVAGSILEGLTRLEYRGYDSAGIATFLDGRIERRRAVGKLSALREVLTDQPLGGLVGIGHTRWATHGAPTVVNAHPHATDKVAVVHNGIIENFADLRDELTSVGQVFETETDTETIAHLVSHYLGKGRPPEDAFADAVARLEGAFAIAVLILDHPGKVYIARMGSPLAVGRGDGEMFLGSDAYALAPFTNRVTYLQDGDRGVMWQDGFELTDAQGTPVHRPEQISDAAAAMVDKGGHRHFMAKEIHEQPEVVGHTLSAYVDPVRREIRMPEGLEFSSVSRLTISACGTAYYSGLIAKYWFEQWANLSVEIDIASELRYRHVPYPENGMALYISQSGETADTLAALRDAKEAGQKIAALINVPESTIAREADICLPTHAGPEIGVASTKAFTCQLAALAAIAIGAGRQRGVLDKVREGELVDALLETPRHISEALARADEVELLCHELAKARDVLYLGRGVSFPLAMEGALKLKEISYIHAEGYAAGELKHGPIALIDENVPVIVVAPKDVLFEKTISNMQEVMARGGKCLLVSSSDGIAEATRGGNLWGQVQAPVMEPLLTPIVYAVPVQLLAYYTAVAKGTDVDQPRNLAKSVTVE